MAIVVCAAKRSAGGGGCALYHDHFHSFHVAVPHCHELCAGTAFRVAARRRMDRDDAGLACPQHCFSAAVSQRPLENPRAAEVINKIRGLSQKYDFETEYQVVAGANGYFIAKNQKGEYGLLDREGEKAVGFDYSEMEFPKDTMQYQYIKVKQNKNWGIVDYDENPLVPLNFEKVSEYSNGNTIAAGYNGNTTYLYDLKGKEQKKQLTGSGSYSVISDTVFWGKEDIRNEKDNTLVKLEENSLLDKKKNSLAVKVGDTHYAVQKYTTQLTGNLETDQNIEVYEKDEKTQDILPEEEWVKDKDSTVKGSLKLIKAVSDKNIIADMQMDDGFKVIYNIEDGQSTSKYKSIGEFRDGKAFAVDMDNNIKIIDTSGKAINKNDIEVADCG